MTKLKISIASIAVLAVLTACGEGFKATGISSEAERQEVIEEMAQQVPVGITPISKDQQIYNSYLSDLASVSGGEVSALRQNILTSGVDVTMTETGARGASNTISVRAEIMLDCYNTIAFQTSNIDANSFKNGQRIGLNQVQGNGYSMRAECTDSECKEMFVSIMRVDQSIITNPRLLSMVLMGMSERSSRVEGQSVIKTYGSRTVAPQLNADGNHFATAVSVSAAGGTCMGIWSQQQAAPAPQPANVGAVADPTQGAFQPLQFGPDQVIDQQRTEQYNESNWGDLWYDEFGSL